MSGPVAEGCRRAVVREKLRVGEAELGVGGGCLGAPQATALTCYVNTLFNYSSSSTSSMKLLITHAWLTHEY